MRNRLGPTGHRGGDARRKRFFGLGRRGPGIEPIQVPPWLWLLAFLCLSRSSTGSTTARVRRSLCCTSCRSRWLAVTFGLRGGLVGAGCGFGLFALLEVLHSSGDIDADGWAVKL